MSSNNAVEAFIRRNPQFDNIEQYIIESNPELVINLQRFFRTYPRYNINSPNFTLNNFRYTLFLDEEIWGLLENMSLETNINNINMMREYMRSLIHGPLARMLNATPIDSYDDFNNTQPNLSPEEIRQIDYEIDAAYLQRKIIDTNNYDRIHDEALIEQIATIEAFITKYRDLIDQIFINDLNQTLENTRAELERRQPITGEVAEAIRQETASRVEAMRANTARLAALTGQAVENEINEYGECSICLEPIEYGQEIVEAHNKGIVRGGHFFHTNCFNQICSTTNKCPLCNMNIECNNNYPLEATPELGENLKGGKRKRSSRRNKHYKKLITKKRKGKKKYSKKKKGGKKKRATKRKY
jgi:hypothetical protein